jgi:cytochrome c oxidase subunit IV
MKPTRHGDPFVAQALRLAACWLALLTLMAVSLAVSYVHLGVGNVIAGVAIACLKTGLVAWWFMHLRSTAAPSRAATAIALFTLAILAALSGIDHWTRLDDPAPVQPAKQLEPLATRAPS